MKITRCSSLDIYINNAFIVSTFFHCYKTIHIRRIVHLFIAILGIISI